MSPRTQDSPLCHPGSRLPSVDDMTSTSLTRTRISLSRTVIAVAGATVGGLALWLVETRILDVDLTVATGTGTQPVTAVAVVLVAVVAGIAGAVTARLLTRFGGHRVRTVWTVLAAVVLTASLLGPLGATSPAAVLSLAALHLVVGLSLLVGLRPSRHYGE